jgi:glycosyltransferase involved in cell wall biosynthesis
MEAEPARPLTVLQVVRSDGFAGVERYICEVANELAGRGHRVEAIGGDPARMGAELMPDVHHTPAATVAQVTRALVAHRRADVVHAHMTAAEAAAWLARPVVHAPVVATRHFPGVRGTGAVASFLAGVTSRPIARDIAISAFVADHLEGPSVLLPNGVADQPQADLSSPVVVMLQRLVVEKSPDVGLRAWAASGLGGRGWRLVVAGRGDLGPSMVELADELGITDSVDFVGLVADTDGLLAASSVLLAPAPAEPFGLSVVEAMAHGLPVVAARGGAHLETVGDDGLTFPVGDAEAAGVLLASVADDADLRRRVGVRLRRRQQSSFSLPRHVDRLELLYRQVIDQARGRRS